MPDGYRVSKWYTQVHTAGMASHGLPPSSRILLSTRTRAPSRAKSIKKARCTSVAFVLPLKAEAWKAKFHF